LIGAVLMGATVMNETRTYIEGGGKENIL
jgi:hypothetical protein